MQKTASVGKAESSMCETLGIFTQACVKKGHKILHYARNAEKATMQNVEITFEESLVTSNTATMHTKVTIFCTYVQVTERSKYKIIQ